MKTVKNYSIYDSRCIESPEDGVCFEAGIDTLREARKSAVTYGEGNCIYEVISEQHPREKHKYFIKKEKFIKQIYSK